MFLSWMDPLDVGGEESGVRSQESGVGSRESGVAEYKKVMRAAAMARLPI